MVPGVPDPSSSADGMPRLVTAYNYAARDQAAAESMADAMAAFGYAEVGARPTHRRYLLDKGMGWEVVVIDDIPYPHDDIGLQQDLAVQRQARAIARAHGGYALGSRTDRLFFVDPAPPVLRLNPGSRPLVPRIPEITVPPPGDLALVPDGPVPRPPRLDDLDALGWSEEAYATGTDPIPAQLAGLARAHNDQEWSERELELLSAIRPEGQCRPDTGLALTILARLVVEDALAALRRRDVYALLIDVCAQYARDVVSYANIVAVTGHPPRPHTWSVQAREAVEAAVPALLARWEIEPPANRFALAVLAGAFPSPGQVLAERVALLTAEQAGTRAGTCSQVAYQLITGDHQGAAENAAVMLLWSGYSPAYDFSSEFLDPATLAQAILANEVIQLLW